MRYTGNTINKTIKLAKAEHAREPSPYTANLLGKLYALRSLYETTVFKLCRIDGVERQRSLREMRACYRLLKTVHGCETFELRSLRRAISEARTVPTELPEIEAD